MEFEYITSCPGPVEKLVFLLCFFWPFIAVSLMAWRGRSASPMAAALVPLAVSAAGMWLTLARTAEALSISGAGKNYAAAIAEALATLFIGGCFALAVIVFVGLRRHRPFVDRVTAMLVAVFTIDVIGALLAAPLLLKRLVVPFPILIAGAIVAGVVAAIAMVWTFLTGRGRVSSNALSHGVAVVAILTAVMGVITWEIAHGYTALAIGR